ncbi:MAG: hypothetical protein ACRDZX_13465 [Acidimicrobiales bacterium]
MTLAMLDEALKPLGISSEALIKAVLDGVAGARQAPVVSQPITPEALGAYSAAGWDLSPLPEGEPDSLVGTARWWSDQLAHAWTVTETAEALGVDPSRVRQRLNGSSLLGVKVGREWRVLLAQFVTGNGEPHEPPGLAEVLRAVPRHLPAIVVASWLSTPQPELQLDGEPLAPTEWLERARDIGRAVSLANVLDVFA